MRVLYALGLILESVTIPKGVKELKVVVVTILVTSNWKSLSDTSISLLQIWW